MIYTVETIKEIIKPTLDKFNVRKVGLFGSYARGEATEKSDLDFLVEFDTSFDLYKYNQFMFELKKCFNKKIDVLDYRCIFEVFKDSILGEEVLLYEQR